MSGSIATVVFGIIAYMSGILTKFCYDEVARIYESKQIATALAAEIEAIIFTINQRDYVASISEIITHLGAGQDVKIHDFLGNVEDINRVYRGTLNSGKLGVLAPPLAVRVARLYRCIDNLVIDTKRLTNADLSMSVSTKQKILLGMLEIWNDAEPDARHALNDLVKIANQGIAITLLRRSRRSLSIAEI